MINCCQLCYIILWFRPYPYSLLVTLIVVDEIKLIQGLLSIWIWNLNKYSVCVLSNNVHRVIWQYCDVQAPWIYKCHRHCMRDVTIWDKSHTMNVIILEILLICCVILHELIAVFLQKLHRNMSFRDFDTLLHQCHAKWPSYRLFYIPC